MSTSETQIELISSRPFVTVVVLNWNGEKFIRRCLESLARQDYPNYEVLVVDNASTDSSPQIIAREFPWVRLVRLPKNLGFAAGNNFGFSISTAKYVIALNNDTEVQPNFVSTLVEEAEKDANVGSVGCKIVQFDSGRVMYCPIYTVEGGLISHRPIGQSLSAQILKSTSDCHFNEHAEVVANCGCAVLYRKAVLRAIGAFDPLLFSDWEDHDLGLRIRLAGFKNVYTPRTVVRHIGGASEGNWYSYKRLTRIVRNVLITHYKNLELVNVFTRAPIAVMLYIGAALSVWVRNPLRTRTPFPVLAAGLRGAGMFLCDFEKVHIERLSAQKFRRVSDKEIAKATSIRLLKTFTLSKKSAEADT